MERNPLIVIASRAAGGDDGGGPAGKDAGAPPILETWRRAVESGIGCVIVDCAEGDDATAAAAASAGAYVYRTTADTEGRNYETPSRAERVAATVNRFDRFYNHDVIVNLDPDFTGIAPSLIRALLYPLADLDVDIATLVAPLDNRPDAGAHALVKVDWQERRRVHFLNGSQVGRAVDFSRDPAATGGPPWFRHLPVYAYKRASLDRFVRAEPALRELEERLEPTRALENGMRIDAVMVEGAGTDPATLIAAGR